MRLKRKIIHGIHSLRRGPSGKWAHFLRAPFAISRKTGSFEIDKPLDVVPLVSPNPYFDLQLLQSVIRSIRHLPVSLRFLPPLELPRWIRMCFIGEL